MKKFGTPIGAGPGSENEKLGLLGVGTPPLVAGGGGAAGGVVVFFFLGFFGLVAGLCFLLLVPDDDGLCAFPFPDGFGAGLEDEVIVCVLDCLVVVVGVVDEPVLRDPVGFGFGLGDVDPEVEVSVVVGVEEVGVEEVVEVDDEVAVDVVCGGVVVVGVVAGDGGHDCETWVIGRLTGSGSDVGGVPGGTFWNVNC